MTLTLNAEFNPVTRRYEVQDPAENRAAQTPDELRRQMQDQAKRNWMQMGVDLGRAFDQPLSWVGLFGFGNSL